VKEFFSSSGYIDHKTRSSLEANTVNVLVCLRSWFTVVILVRKRFCYSLFLTEF